MISCKITLKKMVKQQQRYGSRNMLMKKVFIKIRTGSVKFYKDVTFFLKQNVVFKQYSSKHSNQFLKKR